MKIFIGSDHGGFELKNRISEYLKIKKYDVEDLGCFSNDSVDYPDIASKVAHSVVENDTLGILVCGTGIGMSIAANKINGVRASLVSDVFSAKATREHNNSNILCLGQRVIGDGLALEIVDNYLSSKFQEGRHLNRVNKIKELENE